MEKVRKHRLLAEYHERAYRANGVSPARVRHSSMCRKHRDLANLFERKPFLAHDHRTYSDKLIEQSIGMLHAVGIDVLRESSRPRRANRSMWDDFDSMLKEWPQRRSRVNANWLPEGHANSGGCSIARGGEAGPNTNDDAGRKPCPQPQPQPSPGGGKIREELDGLLDEILVVESRKVGDMRHHEASPGWKTVMEGVENKANAAMNVMAKQIAELRRGLELELVESEEAPRRKSFNETMRHVGMKNRIRKKEKVLKF